MALTQAGGFRMSGQAPLGLNGLNLRGICLKQFLNFPPVSSVVVSFSRSLPCSATALLLTLILSWFEAGGGGGLYFSLFLFVLVVSLLQGRTLFSALVFCSETPCSAPKLPVTWEMAEQSRHVCSSSFGDDEHCESLANRSQDALIFSKWVSVTQGPYLSYGNNSFTIKFSLGYSSWEEKAS